MYRTGLPQWSRTMNVRSKRAVVAEHVAIDDLHHAEQLLGAVLHWLTRQSVDDDATLGEELARRLRLAVIDLQYVISSTIRKSSGVSRQNFQSSRDNVS